MINDYALLARLPLLQGIGSSELLTLEEALRLGIDEFPASRLPLIRQGDHCTQLLWLVEGEMLREHRSADGCFTTRSSLKAPAVIEVERLYGLYPTHRFTYWAKTDIKMLSIRKSLVGSHLMKNEVFRLGLLGLLSSITQKQGDKLLPRQLGSIEERLQHFVRTVFPVEEGEAELLIKMTDLARYLGDSRLITSRLLRRLHQQGTIRLGREHFVIHDLQALLKTSPATTGIVACGDDQRRVRRQASSRAKSTTTHS